MTPWYKESFGEDYLLVYKHRSQEEAEQQVAAILPLLQLTSEDRILDLCCGTGRHAAALAKKGFDVTGLDLSDVLLSHARRQQDRWPVTYVQGDMRELPFPNQSFDVVLNLFTSFGYFVEDHENERVLREIARVLAPKGRFFIDFLNREHVRQHLNPLSVREENGLTIREERHVDGDYVKKTITIAEDGDERVYYERVKMYTCDDMLKMAEQAGLHVERVLGDYDGTAYAEDTPRMIFIGWRSCGRA